MSPIQQAIETIRRGVSELIVLEEENRQLLSIVRRQHAQLRQVQPPDAEAEMVLAEADLLER